MHLLLLTRGIEDRFQLWKNMMSAQMFEFPRIPLKRDEKRKLIEDGLDENGIKKYKHITYETDQIDLEKGKVLHRKGEEAIVLSKVAGSLRPMQLFEYVFPDEALPEVLGMMDMQGKFPLRPEVEKLSWFLRKGTGFKPIPKEVLEKIKDIPQHDLTEKRVPMHGMAVYPIGIKEDLKHDYVFPNGEAYYQEGL